MSEYILHFPDSSQMHCRAVYPLKLREDQRSILARKLFCVPDSALEGGPLLRLCDEREFEAWQRSLPKVLRQPPHVRVLMVLVQRLEGSRRSLAITKALLSFAHITGAAILCIQPDGAVSLRRATREECE